MAAIACLWAHTGGLDRSTSDRLLASLAKRSLIFLNDTPPQPGTEPTVTLRRPVTECAKLLIGDSVTLHNQLLAAYGQRCPNGWNSGPSDGYFFEKPATPPAGCGTEARTRGASGRFPLPPGQS